MRSVRCVNRQEWVKDTRFLGGLKIAGKIWLSPEGIFSCLKLVNNTSVDQQLNEY